MGANFTPDMQGYTNMKPFKFWCQKVLPTIYDDSLSYYEVLCKLVKYLNTVIENMEKVEANVDALLNAFNLLQGWVNDYFDNLDVQDEIDDKLDRMVEDGTFDRYIQPILDEFEQTVQTISGHAVDEAREEINTIVGQGESAIRDTVILYEQQAHQYVDEAEAWARGTIDGVPVPSTAEQYEDNSKFWAEQAQQAVQSIGSSVQDAEDAAQAAEDAQEAAEQAAQSIPTDVLGEVDVTRRDFFTNTGMLTVVDSWTTDGGVTINQAGLVVVAIKRGPIVSGVLTDNPISTGVITHNVGDYWTVTNCPIQLDFTLGYSDGVYSGGLGTLDRNMDYEAYPYWRGPDTYTVNGEVYLTYYAIIRNKITGLAATNGETLHLRVHCHSNGYNYVSSYGIYPFVDAPTIGQ